MGGLGFGLWTLKAYIVSHERRGTRRVGEAYLKYVTDNKQAKEGKVLRTDLYTAI